MKRVFDIFFSLIGIVILVPVFLIISIVVLFSGRGGVFFMQKRVGKNEIEFLLLKFRTMRVGSEKNGQLTIGSNDSRITKVGNFLRKKKLDELPQLFNVLIGDMSLVGPRPEVKRYVDLYNTEQRKVFSVRPGVTDMASLKFIDESDLLAKSSEPEKTYIEVIMPQKLAINLAYINERSIGKDFNIILKTCGRIFSRKRT